MCYYTVFPVVCSYWMCSYIISSSPSVPPSLYVISYAPSSPTGGPPGDVYWCSPSLVPPCPPPCFIISYIGCIGAACYGYNKEHHLDALCSRNIRPSVLPLCSVSLFIGTAGMCAQMYCCDCDCDDIDNNALEDLFLHILYCYQSQQRQTCKLLICRCISEHNIIFGVDWPNGQS